MAMTILFLTRLYSPHLGGVEKHVQKISQQLVKKGHSVTIITSQHDKSLQLQEEQGSIKIFRLPSPLLFSKISTWKWILKHKHHFKHADVIHAHDVFWWYLPLRFIMPHKKIFTTFHGWEGTYPPTKGALLSRKIASLLSTKTIHIGHYIQSWYANKPDLVSYGATDQPPLPPSKNQQILVLGRLSQDNDLNFVIQALKKIKRQEPSTKITFLGDGELAPQASKIGKVEGFKPNISPYLKSHRLVITSSYLSILDSLAAGLQVFSVYSNPLKKDYLSLHPASQWFSVSSSPTLLANQLSIALKGTRLKDKNTKLAQTWATKQTWQRLTSQYLQLWKS